jgi:multidrug efflux pump
VSGPGAAARNSIGMVLVSGMTIGTLFTLFVVPVFYSLIAAQHQQSLSDEGIEVTDEDMLLVGAKG